MLTSKKRKTAGYYPLHIFLFLFLLLNIAQLIKGKYKSSQKYVHKYINAFKIFFSEIILL